LDQSSAASLIESDLGVAVEEVVEDGLTGHIVDSIEEATVTLPRVMALDRRVVRQRFEQRFAATRMANDYVRVYNSLLARANVKLVPGIRVE
jgi:hypothetical protein